jgi:hypothetical protein
MQYLIGQSLGRYHILEQLGEVADEYYSYNQRISG